MVSFSDLLDILQRSYIKEAFIVGICMALCGSLLGVSLVLKKHSMIGDGLSHVGFGAVAIAACMGVYPLIIAIPIVIVSSFLILYLAEKSKVLGDSIIAIFSTLALAIGYAAIKVSDGINFDIDSYLYGSLFGVSKTEIILSIILTIIIIIIYVILHNKIFSVTFDTTFSKSCGTNTNLINIILSILTSLTIVIGMKVMGALLITAIIIFPTLSSRLVFKTFKYVTIVSVILSVISFILGLLLSCIIIDMPIGSAIVFVNAFMCLIMFIVNRIMYLKKN